MRGPAPRAIMALQKLTVISDRRGHERQAFRTDALLTLPGGRNVLAQTLDVGMGGAAVVTDVNPPIGAPLTIRMSMPARPSGQKIFQAQARVANATLSGTDGGFRLGLQFESLDSEAQAALKGVLPQR